MLANKLLSSLTDEPIWAESVFSAYTYTGNGSTQTITNGIDLAGKGGMVWIKDRLVIDDHVLYDTVRTRKSLKSNTTAAEQSYVAGYELDSYNPNGFTLATGYNMGVNSSGKSYISWTFRKAPKFFDVVTYTGNGVAGRQIPHALGQEVGMLVVKQTSSAGQSWAVYHRSLGGTYVTWLDMTNAASTSRGGFAWNNTAPSTTVFTVGDGGETNSSGQSYVAYLFAHDTSTDGLIQCGSFTSTGVVQDITLGWEPQFVMLKKSNNTSDWAIKDVSRGGLTATITSMSAANLSANASAAESTNGNTNGVRATATGFQLNGDEFFSDTVIYLAIRRPNKPPTLGTQVYNAIARGSSATTITGTGFPVDLLITSNRTSGERLVHDRLRGVTQTLDPTATGAEYNFGNRLLSFQMDGYTIGSDSSIIGPNKIDHFFKRAVGVFDEVCYTGTGVAKTEAHGLGVVPELIIVKRRAGTEAGGIAGYWSVYHAGLATPQSGTLLLNTTDGRQGGSQWNNTLPTASVFSLYTGYVNYSGDTYVAYLFASKAGISKCFSFTGDGTTGRVINCGFTTGARFILIKRTDAAGDWFVYDTVRGYPAGNDGHLSLNTTAAEVITTDDVDYEATGFIVNQNATTNLNVTSATYIGLAYA